MVLASKRKLSPLKGPLSNAQGVCVIETHNVFRQLTIPPQADGVSIGNFLNATRGGELNPPPLAD